MPDRAAEYVAWIAAYKERAAFLRGMCASATQEMVTAFPELKRVPGWAYPRIGGCTEHFWCEAPDGTIFDPTADQWEGGVADYQAWKPGDEVHVGRCMNCGDDIYRSVESLGGERECVCSPECEEVLRNDLDMR